MCWEKGYVQRKWFFSSLLMGTKEDEGTRHFSRMINSSGILRLILFISFIRNEAVRALIYTAASFISSTTLSHTRHHFFTVSLVSVDSLPSFRRWWELIALQIVAEYKRFSYLIFWYIYIICHEKTWVIENKTWYHLLNWEKSFCPD